MAAALVCISAAARLSVKEPCSDGMVLQQQSKAAIWGEATPGKKVKISASWSKSKFEAYADENGKWFTRISTPKAGGP